MFCVMKKAVINVFSRPRQDTSTIIRADLRTEQIYLCTGPIHWDQITTPSIIISQS